MLLKDFLNLFDCNFCVCLRFYVNEMKAIYIDSKNAILEESIYCNWKFIKVVDVVKHIEFGVIIEILIEKINNE